MTDHAWMKTLCGRQDREITRQPWAIILRDEPWTFVTDGHGLVMVRGAHAESGEPHSGAVECITKLPSTNHGRYPLAALKQFANVPPLERVEEECKACKGTGKRDCDSCNGKGYHECSCDCGEMSHRVTCCHCNGKPTEPCDWCTNGKRIRETNASLPGYACGRLVNRRLLSRFLEHVDAELVEVWTSQDPEDALHVIAPEWHVIIMPLRETDDTEAEAKMHRFPVGVTVNLDPDAHLEGSPT